MRMRSWEEWNFGPTADFSSAFDFISQNYPTISEDHTMMATIRDGHSLELCHPTPFVAAPQMMGVQDGGLVHVA